MEKKNKILNWITMISFGFLLLGGLSFLLMGLFKFDLFAAIFGGVTSVAARVFYSLFGISALMLLGVILWKAFMAQKTIVGPKVVDKTSPAAK